MKKITLYIFILLSSLAVNACRQNETDRLLNQLDKIIENKKTYEDRYNLQIDSMRRALSVTKEDTVCWEYCYKLFNLYQNFNVDSAANYVHLMKKYTAGTDDRYRNFMTATSDISVLISWNNIREAHNKIEALDTIGLTLPMRAAYYTRKMDIYNRLAEDAFEKEEYVYYKNAANRIREKRISFPGHNHVTRNRMLAQYLANQQRYDEALDILLPLYQPQKYDHRTLAVIAHNIANLYKDSGNREKRKSWLARSAISDLQAPVKQYLSLYELALLMFEDQKMDRANKYIHCTIEDVLFCNFQTRVFQSSKAQMIINQAVMFHIESRNRILVIVVVICFFFLAIIVFLLIGLLHQHQKLKDRNDVISQVNEALKEKNKDLSKLNDQIKIVNSHLKDANLIKDSYVFRYMNLSVEYLGRVEDYRHQLRQAAKANGYEALKNLLRTPSNINKEYRDFYTIFDETFLGIFPDFIEQVNSLLEESARFPVQKNKSLTTELRILAVLRLGITDSGRIAHFLNCAPVTIYTYRTKLRNSALCPRNEFEAFVQQIGL